MGGDSAGAPAPPVPVIEVEQEPGEGAVPLLLGTFVDYDTLAAVRAFWQAAGVVEIGEYIDAETVEAIRNLWNMQASLPQLFDRPLQSGRLKPGQASTYAVCSSELDHAESAGTGGAWHDYRRVKIKVYGVLGDVVTAIRAINAIFTQDTVLTYPSGDRFMRWWPAGSDKLEQDPATKGGQDIWIGTVEATVWSIRVKGQGAQAALPAPFAPAVPPSQGGGYEHES